MSISSFFKNLGPGPVIAAAFIGPGTVTVCTLAGVNFDYSLLWALGLSIIATLALQEISGRIGISTGQDLSQLLRGRKSHPLFRVFSMILVLLAIVLGNAAYESGNITGANLGLEIFWKAPTLDFGPFNLQTGNFLIGLIAFILLYLGNYKSLEKILVSMVILMSLAFSITALLTKPEWKSVFAGFIPQWNTAEFLTIVSLIGTTVVPYNLFLYASLANKKWKSTRDISWMRKDIGLSVILGGLVSMAILMVGAANTSEVVNNVLDVSKGLEPIFGSLAKYLMGIGFLAAGLTSSITAPLAAGLVICGIMGWDQDLQSPAMRKSIGLVLLLGLVFASFGIKPVQLITLAQLANGILLPLISAWIIWIGAQEKIMGKFHSSTLQNIFYLAIWLITLTLGLKSIGAVFGIW
ncbi:Nramp family divalent metal transporter [Algoriphagus machipongonensis]|uniref:Mn2+/Fe2+ transporter, NRAMP family n=1 Tax=Algoriphagus machipongonensis TaxID=388413 RepID=A3HRU9_9BACT|nr:Nramp family divalent metal transporter [Algoriphagus machipongonensis]EAZ82567.1 Mn2+/Fe2+ transporter, NRAMP family [Algoriphagus machipongonensis]